jgi:hypothetical protein
VWIAPWEEVTIDLIGPLKVKVNGQQVGFNALTCIDKASNLVKLIILIMRQPNINVMSSLKVGFVDIPVLYNTYMTKEVNSSNRSFNGCWISLALMMYAQQAKINNLM